MHGKKLKIGTEADQLPNLKPFVVWKKYHKDTVKNQQCVNNYAIEKCRSSQRNGSVESTENWCVHGLINFEEPFSGLEELNSNPVWKLTMCNKCEIEIL